MLARSGCAVVLAALALTACTPSRGPSRHSTTTLTSTVPAASPPATAPIASGPTSAVPAASCPYATQDFVHNTIGMRLGRITLLKSDGRTVGCRFYPLSQPNAQCDATCLHGEHLPRPDQPVAEITTQRYPSAVAAHNAFVVAARAGRNPQQVNLGRGIVGVCFQTDFYPPDRGSDWACAASKGATALLVRTVVTNPALNAKLVTERVLRAV